LLIEFDPEKSFSLQNANELGADIRSDSISSKLALLAMHFPKLRILWSRSPHETLRIFRALKVNHDEVNVEKAMEFGQSESVEAMFQVKDGEDDEVNDAARDMLLRLPGVTVHTARKIMEEVDSLSELASLSRQELRRIAGPITGQKLFSFFNMNSFD
jgi:DNA excision repair protein ERCC-4